MALTDLSALRTSLQSGIAEAFISSSPTFSAGRISSFYRFIIAPGQAASPAIPTTPVALDNTDVGALNRLIPSQTPSNIYGVGFRTFNTNAESTFFVIDRLSHMGGLSGTVTTAQTVNTAALTRYTSGVGVYAAIEVYTAVGTTVTTVSMTYTNSDGVGSRVSPLMIFGTSGFGAGTGGGSRFMVMPLQDGDKGVQSVQSVTVTASTGTAGNFGITLFKALGTAVVPVTSDTPINILSGGVINIPQYEETACISLIAVTNTSATTSICMGALQWGTD